MWYVAEMLFAQPKVEGVECVVCEECDVLFEAATAIEAYDKALAWAADYADDPTELALVGIENVRSLNEPPADGVEVGGGFYESEDIWERQGEIPARDEIVTIRAELAPETKVSEMLNDRKRGIWKKLSGDDAP